jgi:CBS domain-containing protein
MLRSDISRHPGRTSSPLRPSLSFRYIQRSPMLADCFLPIDMLMLLVEENGVNGMRPNCGGETGTATQINEIGGQATRWEEAMSIESILMQKGTDVTTIAPEASIKRAADWLRAKNIGALVVTSGNAVLGLISEREIVHAFSRYGETAASMPVKEIMQYGVTTVSPDESVNRVMNLMTRHRVRHMPVLRGGNLAGIVSIGDVVKYRLQELELETNVLRDVYNAAR